MTYTIQIEMTPTMDDLLPMSLLQSMARDKSKSLDSWFQSRGIPLEYFHLYAEPITIKNASFARKIIARVGKMNAQVMIENVLNKIQKALSKEWQIMSHDQVYSYSVNIDKFKTYVIDGLHERFNEVEEIERQDVTSDVTSEQVVKEKIYEEIIFRREQHAFYAAPLIYLTKMNFCEKVHLERSEWIGLYQEIRLNLTGSNDERVLGDSEYNIYSDDQGKAAVAICVDDFNPLYNNKMSPNIGSANRSISKSVACVYTLYFFAALLYI